MAPLLVASEVTLEIPDVASPALSPFLVPDTPIAGPQRSEAEIPEAAPPEPGADVCCSRSDQVCHLVAALLIGALAGSVAGFVAGHFSVPRIPSHPDSCPNKWVRSDGKCFFKSLEIKTWESSLEFCQSEGGTLLTMDEETQQEIKKLYNLAGDHWVGLKKDTDSGEWRQLNGSVWTGKLQFDDPQMNCGFIDSGKYGVLDCSTRRPWICVKARLYSDRV